MKTWGMKREILHKFAILSKVSGITIATIHSGELTNEIRWYYSFWQGEIIICSTESFCNCENFVVTGISAQFTYVWSWKLGSLWLHILVLVAGFWDKRAESELSEGDINYKRSNFQLCPEFQYKRHKWATYDFLSWFLCNMVNV